MMKEEGKKKKAGPQFRPSLLEEIILYIYCYSRIQ